MVTKFKWSETDLNLDERIKDFIINVLNFPTMMTV